MIDMAQNSLSKKNHSGVTKKMNTKKWLPKWSISMKERSMEQVSVLIVDKVSE